MPGWVMGTGNTRPCSLETFPRPAVNYTVSFTVNINVRRAHDFGARRRSGGS